ncbi:MAG: acetyl-CoA carboxylase biotin carboxylase subunit [Firmicutes bacterium]|nr:acetyl-CoA carboxylase biotin carboxylase subunit [Bacillota bacterium]NLL88880.1 acetyl-CoA carboxylase biotin carboxylase subunit [Bacillota bacterium]
MFGKVLIANRGEIALRIIRACRELGIGTVAIYSEADRNSLHVKCADEAVCVGPPPSQSSYLHIPNIITAAVLSKADAIHPGYGYLSERADFAEICEDYGLIWIGPGAAQIEKMGDKAQAKAIMKQAGVPVIPGSDGPVANEDQLVALACKIGYPLMIKAVAGGGGKGMRVINDEDELLKGYRLARAEAGAAFGDDQVYIEKYIANPRHIEIQLLGDHYGNIVHFGERECSLQRRHQKVIEECPSPVVTAALRQQIGSAAVKGARAVNYVNAGTIEFLLDQDSSFYFLEMNTRIQVEHPVTEMVYGIDLVKAQIQIAAGAELEYDQSKRVPTAHAIECRLNAEDPDNDFLPSPGVISSIHIPGGHGIRWDSHVYQGYEISPYYDSMFGKLIAWGGDREEAIDRMLGALSEMEIVGIKHNISFHQCVLNDPKFKAGEYGTSFLQRLAARLAADRKLSNTR